MLNEVLVQGYVTSNTWLYDNATYFRIAIYRDLGREPKKGNPSTAPNRNFNQKDNRDAPDYVTVKLSSNGLPVAIRPGMKVQVNGYLQSRQYNETLDDWLSRAKGPKRSLTVSEDFRHDLYHERTINEIVCERLQVLETPEAKPERNSANPNNGKAKAPSAPVAKVVQPESVVASA